MSASIPSDAISAFDVFLRYAKGCNTLNRSTHLVGLFRADQMLEACSLSDLRLLKGAEWAKKLDFQRVDCLMTARIATGLDTRGRASPVVVIEAETRGAVCQFIFPGELALAANAADFKLRTLPRHQWLPIHGVLAGNRS